MNTKRAPAKQLTAVTPTVCRMTPLLQASKEPKKNQLPRGTVGMLRLGPGFPPRNSAALPSPAGLSLTLQAKHTAKATCKASFSGFRAW